MTGLTMLRLPLRVDLVARLAHIAAPRMRRPAPMAPRCRHRLIDCVVDASSWCELGHPTHPARACVRCGGVVDVLESDRTAARP